MAARIVRGLFTRLRQDPAYRVAALLTTVNEQFGRVAIHGFREELLDLAGRVGRIADLENSVAVSLFQRRV